MDFIEDYYPGYNIGFEVLVRDASNKYIYFRVVESNPRKGIIVDIVPFEDMAYEYEPVGDYWKAEVKQRLMTTLHPLKLTLIMFTANKTR